MCAMICSKKLMYHFFKRNIHFLQPAFFSSGELQPACKLDLQTSVDSNEWRSKIIYNEVIHRKDMQLKLIARKERRRVRQKEREMLARGDLKMAPSIFVRRFMGNSLEVKNDVQCEPTISIPFPKAQFPFQFQYSALKDTIESDISSLENDMKMEVSKENEDLANYDQNKIKVQNPKEWIPENSPEIIIEDRRFGTADPNIPVSDVPCGGCGALLHCTNPAIPGFMPKEVFTSFNVPELRAQHCQRCLFLKEFDVALGINVNPNEYPEILRQIRQKRSLIILMVDLLDFPCSIWPDIMNLIGKDKPLIVLGNKADLIIKDGADHIKHMTKCLVNELVASGIPTSNLRHVSLISAKTGYGVEDFINKIHDNWRAQADIYLVGCTNVGKSTLFNTLIQSDLCKAKAVDVLQRATVSRWPGTTLNLLKFPVQRCASWRTHVRKRRLQFTNKKLEQLMNLYKEPEFAKRKKQQIVLMNFIGRSFRNWTQDTNANQGQSLIGLNPNDPDYLNSVWCYDTPGVVHDQQILNLLTTSELFMTLPRSTVIPRNFKLSAGMTLFVGGLARLDCTYSPSVSWFTVFASSALPITITKTEDADLIYRKLLGSEEFAVPHGGEERLEKWPELRSREFEVCGRTAKIASADIVLSSAGWVAVTVHPGYSTTFVVWTPEGRGIYCRKPSLVRHSSSYRYKKIPGTPAYQTNIEIIDARKLVNR